ncbi:P-loop containing nucleoside triphosphate hydrolase [Pseudocohnilembus persalinus]|uniref:p-loop containing nucleoside triphosphate hydrolase n=1 Tax=Pseudocohnilembus persalinus TaxID=266149 RepID=A0A0V0R3Z9_PSEPJ|nr:P-loop containing nucleoside triphosphate hydrolase [Pseudocohnilembus persalinus]|eukprot:KRX09201.1 P-loop containing nucleoside triphosphate hydrolase [Pseudocohnilembus persalinus]
MIRANTSMLDKMLKSIFKGKIQFFEYNPSGRILNRFSNDGGICDRLLPFAANQFFQYQFAFLAFIAYVAVQSPIILIFGFVALILVLIITKFAKKCILQTRILELFMRNPITSLYSETINSLVTIRVYNLENHFSYLVKNYLTHWTKANIAWWATSRYLSFFGELIAVAFSGISIVVLINDRSISIDTLGISIQYLVMITDYIQNICMGALEVNMQMSSPCRIQNYINFEQKENYICDIDRVLQTQKWPRQGNITFQNVYMKYRENLKYQLKNINFRVNAGEKVAIIGRSGAGKSTIFSILFRIFEISKNQTECPNSTIFIDGVDISQVGVQLLRNAITIIPQFPQFFTGSLRENLDPFQRHTDYEIKGAIQLFELEKILAKLEDGLDTEAKNMIISIGARQLFFFVKAYLNKTKILLFDEATGMLDRQSSDVINKKVQTLFQNTTILTVAHRLQSVAFYDKIIMLEKGELIEQGHPYKLLVNDPKRDQTITNTSGYFSLMVQQEGKKTMQKFFKVCQQNYRQKVIQDQQQKLHNIQQSTLKNITSEIISNNRKKNATQYNNNKISNNNNDLNENSNDLQLNKTRSQPQQQFKQIQTLSNINKNFLNKEQIINDQLISMNGSQLI